MIEFAGAGVVAQIGESAGHAVQFELFEWCCHGNWLVSAAGGE